VTPTTRELRLPAGRIVGTAATGFIGTWLLRSLASVGRASDVVAVARRGPHRADLHDPGEAEAVIRDTRPAVLFHLAGLIDSQNLDDLYASNVATTRHLLDATLKHAPTCRAVVPGSAAEYGRVPQAELPISEDRVLAPLVPYGLAKVWQSATARYFAERGANVVLARLFNLVGEGASTRLSVGGFAEQLRRIKKGDQEPRITVGDLSPRRDFIDVADACAALLAVAAIPDIGTYNVCRGSSISMAEVLDLMVRESGLSVEIAVDTARMRHRAEIPDSFGNPGRLRAATGWTPLIPLTESLARMLAAPSAAQ
jgi:GDP-4-dehydro-6-deoxy-D-mannose reductase